MGKKSINNQHIMITGASGGLGEKIAYEVAKRGAIPILVARTEEKLHSIAEDIQRLYNITCYTYVLDISDLNQINIVIQQIIQDVGYIDVLINNAGFGVFEAVAETSMETISSMFQVNVLGLIACTKAVLPTMLKRNRGHIINVASQAGKLATPKSSGYAASKHAVLGFTNGLRMEVAKTNIVVTAINPGPIQTNFFTIADQSGTYEKSVGRFMLHPQYVAEKIVNVLGTSKREVNLPRWMGIGSTFYQLAPGLVEKIAGDALNKK
ncbi:SDR family oxidoreductase [Priestia megaterium]|nr:SDR family oxidoreductase [Priestia megaterium]